MTRALHLPKPKLERHKKSTAMKQAEMDKGKKAGTATYLDEY